MTSPLPMIILQGEKGVRFSVKNATENLSMMGLSSPLERTLSGKAVSHAQTWVKYKAVIKGKGEDYAHLMSLSPGNVVQVDCLSSIIEKKKDSPEDLVSLSRIPVKSSLMGLSGQQKRVKIPVSQTGKLMYGPEIEAISYRPRLSMIITDLSIQTAETGKPKIWTLTLEEK